jgi:hypothetical protein
LLQEQNHDEAATKFAQAAVIEEYLSRVCEEKGLIEKSFVHSFSAASCWTRAGNFYQAMILCDPLLKRQDIPPRLHKHIEHYVKVLGAKQCM